MEFSSSYASPIGNLNFFASEIGLTRVEFNNEKAPELRSPLLEKALSQVHEYFDGKRTEFDLELDATGTEFQKTVWKELRAISYGQTLCYGELAKRIRKPKASRAVGQANNRNPLAIIVPCHRVIGKNGSLVGYAGGLMLKKWLLEHEGSRS